MAEGGEEIIFECPKCWAIIPYLECPHNCLGDDRDEEGFSEDLEGWQKEIKQKMKDGVVWVVEAPEPEVFELIPNEPVVEYQQQIIQGEGPQAYHIRQEGEEVADDVERIRVM